MHRTNPESSGMYAEYIPFCLSGTDVLENRSEIIFTIRGRNFPLVVMT